MKKRKKAKKARWKKKQALEAPVEAIDALSVQPNFREISQELEKRGWGRDVLTKLLEGAFSNIGASFLKLKPYFELKNKALEVFMDAAKWLSWSSWTVLSLVHYLAVLVDVFWVL